MTEHERRVADRWGRPIRDLRISVTDQCNFRCRYCMPEELFGPDYRFLSGPELLTFDEFTRIARIFASLGAEKVRITGGEPLLRRNLPSLVEALRQVDGIRDIAMTTNGSLLALYAKPLKEAGMNRVTVSLDSLDDGRFGWMNGRGIGVSRVLEGIEAAAAAGMQVKVNMVVQKGVNDEDIVPMAEFFREKGHILRFIEYMDVGNSNGWKLDQVVPSRDIVERIHRVAPLEAVEPNHYGEVAARYRYWDGKGEIGLISSVTQAFCSTCTRARLSADGQLYSCLFASTGTDLRALLRNGSSDEDIRAFVAAWWERRDDRYSEIRLTHTPEAAGAAKVEMSRIGG